jgi:glycosyltransferase involved in cell wall biosynthesis
LISIQTLQKMNEREHAFVIPVYRQSPWLQECIESLLGQSTKSGQIVVTTSTPSPELESVVRQYDLPLLINPQSKGIASDWNFALHSTQAKLVTIAHQDDSYFPDYLTQMLQQIDRAPEFLIAYCDNVEHKSGEMRRSNLNLRVKRWLTQRAFKGRSCLSSPEEKLRLLRWGNPVCCPSVIYHRTRLLNFSFSNSFDSNLDWEAWERLARMEGEFLYVDRPLVSKRVHAGSETSALIANTRRATEDRQMFDKFWPRLVSRAISQVYKLGYLSNKA